MWNVFRIINLLWLFISTSWWVTAAFNPGPFLIIINVIMIISMGLMSIKINFDARFGKMIAILILIALWITWIDGLAMGLTTTLMYLPVLYLIQLPIDYKENLLSFTTKWYAILVFISLLMYFASLFITLPSIGTFVHSIYPPFLNHIFYLETTFDYGTFVRFNAFFLEPGHQALLSTFLILANRFRFKECPWLWILLIAVIFSFSLAGYLLLFTGYALLKINSLLKAFIAFVILAAVVGGATYWSGGNNAMNELIISRLEQDSEKGIKGNNRFTNNTDFTYMRILKSKDIWTGVKEKTNIKLIEGAGYKIYIINYGLIGVILSFLFYLSLVPSNPDYRYTISFIIVLILCFIQRSYPTWYSWLFPYVMGIYLAKYEKGHKTSAEQCQTKTINE